MKLLKSFCCILIVAFPIFALAQECYNNATPADLDSGVLGFITNRDSDIGCRGLHISELQFLDLGMQDFGFGVKSKNNRTLADDFTLNKRSVLDQVKFYALKYRIRSSDPVATINPILESAFLRIWDGKPGEPGSSIIHGNLTDNVLVSSVFTQIYRTNDRIVDSCERPIMEVTVDLKCVELDPGKYWLEWQFKVEIGKTDFLAYRSVPLTRLGQSSSGDALISKDDGSTYEPVLDSGTKTPQGFPFIISCKKEEVVQPIPTMGEWGLISLGLLLLILGTTAIKQSRLQTLRIYSVTLSYQSTSNTVICDAIGDLSMVLKALQKPNNDKLV